ncbi:MAG TPA: hypothetical protein VMS99_07675 [Acidimicrobiia bacterium]|nr:hypothetical protein [Acidimicrobiia bacterium]
MRTIFVLLAIFTGGVFILVYVAMIFIFPLVPTHADYLTLREIRARGQTGEPE